jgi:hypothetical protein
MTLRTTLLAPALTCLMLCCLVGISVPGARALEAPEHKSEEAQERKSEDARERRSHEYIFRQQQVDFTAHDDLPGGGTLLLGGAIDAGNFHNFPLAAGAQPKDAAMPARVFLQDAPAPKDAVHIADTIGPRPLPGFGRPVRLGKNYIAAVSLDWSDPKTLRGQRETLLASFDPEGKSFAFHAFEDAETHARLYLQPAAATGPASAAAVASRPGEKGSIDNFIVEFDDKLETRSAFRLPATCVGRLLFEPSRRRYLTMPRNLVTGKTACLMGAGGKDFRSFSLPADFTLDDAAVGDDGMLLVAGKRQLDPPIVGRSRNRPTQLLLFDRDLKFVSGIELTDVLDDFANSVYAAPGGGFLLAAALRESPTTRQSRTALLRLDDKLGVAWGARKDGSGPGPVTSALLRPDGSASVLVRLELYRQPARRDLLGRRVMTFAVVSSLNSFAVLEFGKDGHERGDMTAAFQPRTAPVKAAEGDIFKPDKSAPGGSQASLASSGLRLADKRVALAEAATQLEPKTLGRPWDDNGSNP